MINLKVRLKQQWFWITLIPLLFLFGDNLYELAMAIKSYTIGDILAGGTIEVLALKLIGVLFSIAALIGFPVDMTTDGYADSARALGYDKPAPNAKEIELLTAEEDEKIANAKHAK